MKSIFEIMGSVDSASHSRMQDKVATYTSEPRPLDPRRSPIMKNVSQTDNCSRMYSWQGEIVSILKHRDVYVPASPGGGKTLPYMCYWSQHILKINTMKSNTDPSHLFDIFHALIFEPHRLDKILILVPIRQLADQTAQEFYEFFGSMLGEFLRLMINDIITLDPRDAQRNNNYEKILMTIPGLNQMVRYRRELVNRIKRGGFSGDEIRRDESKIKAMEDDMQFVIEKWIKKLTVDRHFTDKPSLVAERTGVTKIGDPAHALVTIAIYQSAPDIISKFGKNLKLVVCDESHKIQQSRLDDSSTSKDISNALYKILRQIDQSTRLCFLSGTINPTSAKLFQRYLTTCFKRNMEVIDVPSSAKNKSNITVVLDDKIKSDRELVRIIKDKTTTNNLIILFSKSGIDRLVDAALAGSSMKTASVVNNTMTSRYRPRDVQVGGFGNVSNKPNIDYQKTGMRAVSGSMDIAKIVDTRLRSCAYAGFGFLYRLEGTVREKQKKAKDNLIIGQLFKEKKIRTLLATDAIGVGVNIDVRVLYIPRLEKFNGGKFQLTSTAELAQLLHRTGRGAFKFSRIVTSEECYPTVVNAVSAETNKFTEVDVIKKFPTALCHAKNMFHAAYKGFNKTNV